MDKIKTPLRELITELESELHHENTRQGLKYAIAIAKQMPLCGMKNISRNRQVSSIYNLANKSCSKTRASFSEGLPIYFEYLHISKIVKNGMAHLRCLYIYK